VLESKELLVECIYSLISPGTELAIFTGTHPGIKNPNNEFAKYPFFPGYAAVGKVIAVGSEVRDFVTGDQVYFPGQHERYAVLPCDHLPVLRLPSDFPLELAPFIRIGQIATTALLVSEASPNDTVIVLGLGLIGNIVAQLFKIRGTKVIGIDRHTFRRELAHLSGIDLVTGADYQESVKAIMETTEFAGARTVVEATGNPSAIPLALQLVRTKGEVILLGSTRGTVCLDVYNLIHRKGTCLKGAHESLVPIFAASATDGDKLDQLSIARQIMEWIWKQNLVVGHLVSNIIKPDTISEGYRCLQEDKDHSIGVLIDWRK